ncbi:antitoxin [Cellulomonas massiliensis]|uniref:antitoxin n=1 Tax=Cellulomonas massiliensis TaxID=1465811 RepID=UPI0002ED02BC|nr:antitoxin [Cellulomonas massiliensis]
MGIDDMKDKASDALGGEKGEQASDTALDKGADAASSATGGSHDEQITKAQSAADERVGDG